MKRIIALLFVTILCFSLTSCGNIDKEKYEKYDELIQLLEEEKYQEAIDEIKKLAESGDKNDTKQKETVSITIDNWQEYFEIKPKISVEKNAFGEIADITLWHKIQLKEEWKNSIIDLNVAFEFSCKDGNWVEVSYNQDTKETNYGEPILGEYYAISDINNETCKVFLNADGSLATISLCSASGIPSTLIIEGNIVQKVVKTYSNIEVHRVLGEITITK